MEKQAISPAIIWLGRTALGYGVCLGVSSWLPLGLHRVVMRRDGWWLFPALFLIASLGTAGFLYVSPSKWWAVLVVPYFLLLVADVLTLWGWTWPFKWSPAAILADLNTRYNISLHLSIGVVLAILLWLAMGVNHG